MNRRPPRSTLTDTPFPYTTLCRSARLHAYLTASFRPPVTDPELRGAWTAFWALARSDARMAAIHAESYAGYRARLGELLIACGAADAERLAIMLTAMVDGLWLELSLDSARDRKSTRLNSSH